MRERKRVPAEYETGDIAGIGENPTTRSGPYCLIVCTWAAAMSSLTSAHSTRTNPPLPRAFLYAPVRSGSAVISAHAATGSPSRRSEERRVGKEWRADGAREQ